MEEIGVDVQETTPSHPKYPSTIEEVEVGQRLMFYLLYPGLRTLAETWTGAICLNVQDGYPVDDKHESLSEVRVYCSMGKIEEELARYGFKILARYEFIYTTSNDKGIPQTTTIPGYWVEKVSDQPISPETKDIPTKTLPWSTDCLLVIIIAAIILAGLISFILH